MRRLAAILLLSILAILPLFAHDWSDVTARVERSLVAVTHKDNAGGKHVCGGFVIHAAKDYILTARHCIQNAPEQKEGEAEIPEKDWPETVVFDVDGVPSRVIARWPITDLVIVEGGRAKPSLDYRRKPLRKGLPVAVVGFGYGLGTSLLLTGTIAAPGAFWSQGEIWLTLDFRSIGGMSGGPIFDVDGNVLGVMQRTDDVTSISRPFSTIIAQTGKFWD